MQSILYKNKERTYFRQKERREQFEEMILHNFILIRMSIFVIEQKISFKFCQKKTP